MQYADCFVECRETVSVESNWVSASSGGRVVQPWRGQLCLISQADARFTLPHLVWLSIIKASPSTQIQN